jgi:hypothetical protein
VLLERSVSVTDKSEGKSVIYRWPIENKTDVLYNTQFLELCDTHFFEKIKMSKFIRNSNSSYDPSFYYFSKGSNHDDDDDND